MFASCSSERSSLIASSSSASANSRAGTRIPEIAPRGISHRYSSRRFSGSSDIEHHHGTVPATRGFELKPVIRDRFDEWRGVGQDAPHRSPRAVGAQLERLDLRCHEPLRFGQEDQLLEPRCELRRAVVRADPDRAPLRTRPAG